MAFSFNLFAPFKKQLDIEEVEIPFLPPNVSLDDVTSEGHLLEPRITNLVNEELEGLPDGRYSKGMGYSPYGTLHTQEKNYAVYYGTRHEGTALGVGGFGKVKLAQRLDGVWFALKVQEHELQDEFKIISLLSQNEGAITTRRKRGVTKHAMLMPYARGRNLEDLIKDHLANKIKIHPLRWLDILIQLYEQVEKLHEKQILHCDLKLKNFIYDEMSNKLIMIDFGLASLMENKSAHVSNSIAGTFQYIAPEIINHYEKFQTSEYTPQSEMYALGEMTKEILGISHSDEEKQLTATLIEKISAILNTRKSSVDFGSAINEAELKANEKASFIVNKTPFATEATLREFSTVAINVDSSKRPRINDAKNLLKLFRHKIASEYPVNVGILNFDEYKALSSDDRIKRLDDLKKYDEILLINNRKLFKKDYRDNARIIRELHGSGIVLHDKIFIPSKKELLLDTISKYMKEKHGIDNTVRRYKLCDLSIFQAKNSIIDCSPIAELAQYLLSAI